MAGIKWTDEENEILKNSYSVLNISDVFKLFPNRTKEAVKAQASKLALKCSNIWTEKENELLKNNYNNLNIEDLLLLFPNKTKANIQKHASKLKLTKNSLHWTEEELIILNTKYSVLNTEEILKLLPNRAKTAIQTKASQLKLKIKTEITFNINAFSVPNNTNSYYAGFIAADGCISDKNSLKIALQQKDANYIEKFNTFMECSRNIKYYTSEQKSKTFYSAEITYTSKKLAADLKKNFLLTPRKTLNVPFPKHLNFDNKLSYIVGNLDGDGSIFRNNKNLFIISWLGDFKFLAYIRDFFFKLNWIQNNTKNLNKMTHTGLYQLRFTGINAKNIYRELRWHIEEYNLPVLERKWFNKGIKHITLKQIKAN